MLCRVNKDRTILIVNEHLFKSQRIFENLSNCICCTPPRIDLLCMKNWGTQWTLEISSNEISAPMAIEKIKIVGVVLELPAKQHCQFSTANSVHLAHFLGEYAELVVLFIWWLQNGPQNFDFFNCHGC